MTDEWMENNFFKKFNIQEDIRQAIDKCKKEGNLDAIKEMIFAEDFSDDTRIIEKQVLFEKEKKYFTDEVKVIRQGLEQAGIEKLDMVDSLMVGLLRENTFNISNFRAKKEINITAKEFKEKYIEKIDEIIFKPTQKLLGLLLVCRLSNTVLNIYECPGEEEILIKGLINKFGKSRITVNFKENKMDRRIEKTVLNIKPVGEENLIEIFNGVSDKLEMSA